jgi:hypothetical protein
MSAVDGTRAHAIESLTSAIQNADDHGRAETRMIVATFVDALIETLQAPDAHAACRESRAEGERRKYLMGYEDGKREALESASSKGGAQLVALDSQALGVTDVINPGLKAGAFGRTTWNTQSNPFPASSGRLKRGPLSRLARAIRTGEQNLGSVEVSMVLVATRRAAEDGLRATRLSVDAAARAACLAGVSGGHLDERASRPRELVAEHLGKAGPSRVGDASSQVAADHARDVQLLQHDDAVALGDSCRLDVQEVVALPPHLPVDAGDACLGLLSILGSFLLAGDVSLRPREARERRFEVAWIGDHVAVGRGAEVGEATVDGEDGAVARHRLGDVHLAGDAHEPLIAVALEGARLRPSFDRPVDDRAQVAELREPNGRTVEAPYLAVRLAEGERVAALALEARGTRQLGEAALPGPVKLHQELRAHVARDVGEPWQRGAQFGELVDLVESGRVDALAPGPRVPGNPLLQGQIPEKSECALPLAKPRDLRGVGVDAESKSLHDAHRLLRHLEVGHAARGALTLAGSIRSSTPHGSATRRRRFLPALKDGVSAPEIR